MILHPVNECPKCCIQVRRESCSHSADWRLKKLFRHFLELLRHHNQRDHWSGVDISSALVCMCVCVSVQLPSPAVIFLTSVFESLHEFFFSPVSHVLCLVVRFCQGPPSLELRFSSRVLRNSEGKSAYLKQPYQLTVTPDCLIWLEFSLRVRCLCAFVWALLRYSGWGAALISQGISVRPHRFQTAIST